MNSESLGALPIRQPNKKAEALKDNSINSSSINSINSIGSATDSKNGATQQLATPNQCCAGACELLWRPAQEAELKTS